MVSHHSQVAKKPTPAATTQSVETSTKQETFSKLTPVYAASPRGAAERVRARYRGMDWVKKEVVTTKKVVQEVVQPEVLAQAAARVTPAQPQGPSVAERIAAELAAHGHVAQEPAMITTTVTETVKTTDTIHEITPVDSLGHALSATQRDLLQQQFKTALAHEAKHSHRKQARKHVVDKVKHHAKRAKSPRSILAVFLFGMILAGAYATIDSFSINQQARLALAEQATEAAVQAETTTTPTTTTEETTDEGDMVPGNASTEPTTRTATSHSVAPDLAKTIKIPKLGINAPVISVGLTSTGAIDTPKNIWEAAWYNGSAKPGQDGAVFMDGHSSANGGALFGHLDRLVKGDTIQVAKGDGTVITYKVVNTAIVDKDAVDMRAMLKPYGGASKGLNLITCEGDWISSERTLTKRVLIWTEQV